MRQNLLVSFLRLLLLSYQASKLKPITKTVSIAAFNQINWYKAKLLKKELSSQNNSCASGRWIRAKIFACRKKIGDIYDILVLEGIKSAIATEKGGYAIAQNVFE